MFVIRDDTRKTFFDMRSKKFVPDPRQATGTKTHAASKFVLDGLRRKGYRRPLRVIQTVEKG